MKSPLEDGGRLRGLLLAASPRGMVHPFVLPYYHEAEAFACRVLMRHEGIRERPCCGGRLMVELYLMIGALRGYHPWGVRKGYVADSPIS